MVLVMCASSVFAQKFGRVDLAAVVTNMPEFKDAQVNLEAYGKDLQRNENAPPEEPQVSSWRFS